MDSYLSLIGSIVIGGLLLFSVLNFQTDVRQHSFEYSNSLIVQQTALSIIELLEQDLRQIGYGYNFPSLSVVALDSNSITFYADLFDDGVLDTVNYWVGDVSEASGTTNPRDKIFYRSSNSDPQLHDALGVTNFQLIFFDANGDTTVNQTEIRTIEVTLEFESKEPHVDRSGTEKYASYYWREKISPMNLQPL